MADQLPATLHVPAARTAPPPAPPAPHAHGEAQHARVTARLGKRTRIRAELRMTPAGLMAVGGMVGTILLSTALLVREAKRLPDR